MTEQNGQHDLVILNGRVMDPESSVDGIYNVGIKGGRIDAITDRPIQGKETIDATGLVVSPGFIDMHCHVTGVPFGEKLLLRDGCTTPLELEGGAHPVKEWYDKLEGKCRANYGISSGTLGVRERVLNPAYESQFAGDFVLDIFGAPKRAHVTANWSTAVANAKQLEMYEEYLEQGIKEGAIGVGHAVGYMTAGCSQEESIIAQKIAGKYGHAVFLHGRYSSQAPPAGGLLGFLESMGAQLVYGGGLVLQHMTAQALNDTTAALAMVDAARAKGVQIIAEIYPYNFGGSIVGADYLVPDNYGPNMGRDYSDIIVTADLKPLTKERYEELVRTAPSTAVMFNNATEETVFNGLANPNTVLGSDAMPAIIRDTGKIAFDFDVDPASVNTHPRSAGARARLLALTREKKIDIPLMSAISKMSYMIADFLEKNGCPQMAKKGRIQEGMDADITMFDPNTVTDNSTMKDGGLPSTGIPYVVVNGQLVVKDSEVLDVFAGQAIYGSEKQA
jgi:hypothetical protein